VTTSHSTAHADLTTIITRWDDLRDMLTTAAPSSWPPAGRMADYQAQLTDDELAELHDQAAAERAERTALAPGERPVPIRLQVLDTITTLDTDLVHLADQIAASVQRPALSSPRPAGPGDQVGLAVRLAAAKDTADPRRWSWQRADRTGLTAATWLLARVDGAPGPFRALLPGERERIAGGAAGARRRIEHTLGLGRREDPIARRCPCGGPMVMRQGGAMDPEVECQKCQIRWFGPQLVQLLELHADAA
jgi:hypothetical protein